MKDFLKMFGVTILIYIFLMGMFYAASKWYIIHKVEATLQQFSQAHPEYKSQIDSIDASAFARCIEEASAYDNATIKCINQSTIKK